MLSKYNAGLFYVFIPIWWFVKYFFGMNDYAKTMRGLWLFLVEFAVSVLVVMVLMPAVFLDFALLWKSTLGIVYLKPIYAAIPLLMLVFVLVLREKWMLWFGSKDSALIIAKYAVVSLIVVLVVASGIVAFRNSADVIPVDAKQFNVPFKPAILFNTLMVGWVASWPFILGLCACVWAIFRHNLLQKAPQVMGVMLFVWLFIAGSSFQGVQLSARYTIMLFPLLAYIVALAVQQVKIPKVWIVIPMLLFPLTDFGLLKPSGMVFYTNNYYWTNDGHLLWGFGGYEIAEKANRLPNAEDLKVLVDYHGFAIFFHGDSDFMEKQMTNAVMDDYDYLYLSTAGYRSKVSWDMLSSDLDFYYQLPDDSAVFVNRDKNTFTRLIKVNKSRTMVFPPNFINTELLIERNTPYTLGAWLQLFNTDQGSPFAIFTTDVATDLQLRVNKGVLSFAGNSVELPHQKKQGEWHLVVITNSDKLRLWYDAKLLAEWPAVNYKSRIALSKNFVGDEDGFRIYYESLTPDLVKAWYNNGVMDHSLLLYRNNEEITMVRNYYKKMNKE
jgi:hypothetical protein